MGSFWSVDPVREIIRVGIRRIEKASIVENGFQGVHRAAAGIPAERTLAGRAGVDADRLRKMSALLRFGHVLVIDPFQSMARDLPMRLAHRRDRLGVPCQRRRYGEYRRRDLPIREN